MRSCHAHPSAPREAPAGSDGSPAIRSLATAPRVVIGVPVHQSERFLAETLESVVAQDHPNIEIVVSDDASTDATAAICQGFARRDPRVRLQRHPRRVGWIANYNSLLPHATGDYFLWVPHDDLYDPGYVRELVALLEARPDAVLAYSATLAIDEGGRVVGGWARSARPGRHATRWHRALRYLWWTEREKFIPFRGVVRTRAIQIAGGLQDGAWGVFADDLWLFRLSLLGGFAHDARPLCRKRLHRGSISSTTRYTLPQRHAYLAAYRGIVREARLPWAETAGLLAAIPLRQAWVTAGWLLRRIDDYADSVAFLGRMRWYLSPAQTPRRLRKLAGRVPGTRAP